MWQVKHYHKTIVKYLIDLGTETGNRSIQEHIYRYTVPRSKRQQPDQRAQNSSTSRMGLQRSEKIPRPEASFI